MKNHPHLINSEEAKSAEVGGGSVLHWLKTSYNCAAYCYESKRRGGDTKTRTIRIYIYMIAEMKSQENVHDRDVAKNMTLWQRVSWYSVTNAQNQNHNGTAAESWFNGVCFKYVSMRIIWS